MEEIEIEEYVRTKDGHIAKYIEKLQKDEDIEDGMLFDNFIYEKHKHIRYCFLKEMIVKHSKQLIDLIKSGDIVNRHLVIDKYEDVDEYGNDFWCLIIEDDSLLNRSIREENIQTIETRGSYMANCYKVGGKDDN